MVASALAEKIREKTSRTERTVLKMSLFLRNSISQVYNAKIYVITFVVIPSNVTEH